ncbi:YmfL family putative regulatory protein [Cupriavidus alkaliphilus]|uniref:YmfL family putative regulatory protein n=1 Tax=Cupriavidus alkaliphilus TaxID=942866 RepID=UPI001795DF69|nr:YmfL family putative regulatory protein [Cupriavidus alkaliphilus]MBB2918306.1 hypothetical protein [Cupriavidus alkaliphilus]
MQLYRRSAWINTTKTFAFPMGIRNAYLSMIRAMPGGWDSMAAALGMSKAALENRVYERKEQRMHVDTAMQIQAFSGTQDFAEVIARESGGVFVPLPGVELCGREELFDKQQELMSDLGDLFSRFRSFINDGEIDRKEGAALEQIEDEVHRTLSEFMAVAMRLYRRNDAAKGAKDA